MAISRDSSDFLLQLVLFHQMEQVCVVLFFELGHGALRVEKPLGVCLLTKTGSERGDFNNTNEISGMLLCWERMIK